MRSGGPVPNKPLTTFEGLDGPAIRNANRGDSRESIRREMPIGSQKSTAEKSTVQKLPKIGSLIGNQSQ